MGITARREHPSNRLYRGEVRDFAEAMRAIEAEVEYELARQPVEMAEPDPLLDGRAPGEYLRRYADVARTAGRLYVDALESVMRQFGEAFERQLRQMAAEAHAHDRHDDGETLTMFAEAFASADYSMLAI